MLLEWHSTLQIAFQEEWNLSMLKYDISNSIFGWDIISIGIKNFI
jgi:hypothetical protein